MKVMATLCCMLMLGATVSAETKVEVKGVHLCCGACIKAAGAAVKGAGATPKCDKASRTVTITASDDATAEKAVKALAAAGFHGTTDKIELAIKDDSGAPEGKVKRLTLSGAHNCCGACCKALKAIVGKVDGVTSEDIKPKSRTFTVTGDFDARELVRALNAAGFHVKARQAGKND
jgi:mercuric ion binding protein